MSIEENGVEFLCPDWAWFWLVRLGFELHRALCLAEDIARLFCLVVDVAQLFCSAVDITWVPLALLLYSTTPSCLTMLLVPPSCLSVALASPLDLTVFLAPPWFLSGSRSFQAFGDGSGLSGAAPLRVGTVLDCWTVPCHNTRGQSARDS